MDTSFSKYIIIGAGLSGLTTAYKLYTSGETDFVVLESRDRIGGRILTKDHVDFGATWFHTHHQHVIELLEDLQVEKFHQYSKGKSVLVYSTMAPENYFENDPSAPSAYRVAGGSSAMIQALASSYPDKIRTGTWVEKIVEQENEVHVETDKGIFKASKVIVTIPPRIATRVSYSPELPSQLSEAMKSTHTWMSNAMKIGMSFDKPFWKDKNLSGTVIGQVGPVVELYDHTDYQEQHFSLMGFINEGLRDSSAEARKTRILDYLKKYLGEEVLNYTRYVEKDWSQDKNTSCEMIKSIYMSPSYGNPVFAEFQMNGKLLFSGAETSPVYGGYMDGAIYSGIQAAANISQALSTS